jgi:predicted RNase H-like HicB family nuclease
MTCAYTAIIKKSGDFYVGLCLELNVASQGDTIEEATRMLQEACQEYLSFVKEEGIEDEIKPVSLDPLREFLIGDEGSSHSIDRLFSKKITISDPCAA